MRVFIKLAYRGDAFHGWQRQPDAMSVQQRLEEALSTILRRPMAVTGAGRTDAGVNASEMFAHCDLPETHPPFDRLVRALNSILGPTVAVYSIFPVADDAHARFDATERVYRYYFARRRTPFGSPMVWMAPPALDFAAMNRAAAILLETDDFTSFSKLHTDARTNICRVTRAAWVFPARTLAGEMPMGAEGYFEIAADRFLRNMVRAVVGTLVDVGRGKLDTDGFRTVIDRRDRCAAGTSMPPEPLFLHSVSYPYPVESSGNYPQESKRL